VTQESVEVPGGRGGFGGCAAPGRSEPVTIVAAAIGEDYNASNGTSFNVSGHPSGSSGVYFNAEAASDVDGGSKRKIKIVSQNDVNKANDQLKKQNVDEVKNQLVKQFDENVVVIDQSFEVSTGDTIPSPAVGDEASDGKAKLSSNTTYSMIGVDQNEINQFLDNLLKSKIQDKKNQRIYENGASEASFDDVESNDAGVSATLSTAAKSGPEIDDQQVKKEAVGKKLGEIQSSIEVIDGVDSVDVKYSPFWVSTAPKDTSRITIEFKLNGK